MASTSPAILTLKRKALECKKAGDIEAAKELLRQVKTIESLSESENPDELKKLAVLLKQHGDLQGAKEALLKSKQIVLPDPVNKAIDEANLEELCGKVEFTDDEMLDVETMADMKAAGMDIPSQQVYLARATACKQAAVAAKQAGDIAAAKQHLVRYKQFEKAIKVLFHAANEGIVEDDDGEDYSVLNELYDDKKQEQDDDGFFEQLFGAAATTVELDDLDDLDASMLKDMIESGMNAPDVNDVLKDAAKKKADAIQFKKNGDLLAAKAALEESKRLESRAKQLAEMLKAIETCKDSEELPLDPEAALEAMLEASEEKPEQPPTKKSEPLKSSHEYKVEAVTCKKEGRLQEAVVALKLYKQALAAENSARVAELRKECILQLQQEVTTAADQSLKYCFYQRFIDDTIGSIQLGAWNEYSRKCSAVIDKLKGGGEPMNLQRAKKSSLRMVRNDGLSFVGKAIDSAEQRIEISILELLHLQTNRNLREILNIAKGEKVEIPADASIRIHMTVQLPPSAEAPDDNIELEYRSASLMNGIFVFGPSQYVTVERGSSRFAKLVARRMTRKRITIEVYYVSPKKGLFSRSTVEKLVGTATIKLSDLLQTNVIAGDFPLMDKRQHELGGCLRVAIRTGTSFAESNERNPESEAQEVKTGLASEALNVEQYAPYVL